jgi:hypothetical protein
LNDDSSHIGTDEDGVDDQSSHIGTDEGPPPARRPFDPFRDLHLHASEEHPVPDDNLKIRYTGANSFKNKDWHKG